MTGLRQRPGDQQLPTPNDRPSAHDEVIALLAERKALGMDRYGSLLQPHNGRDTGRDLLEEIADAMVYARTLATEVTDLEEALRRVVMDFGKASCDGADACSCSMAYARRLLDQRGITV